MHTLHWIFRRKSIVTDMLHRKHVSVLVVPCYGFLSGVRCIDPRGLLYLHCIEMLGYAYRFIIR